MLAVLAAALALGAPAAQADTDLRVVYQPQGRGGPSRSWTLRCGPAGGTLPRPAAACRKLAAMAEPFAPLSPDLVCIELYGGPAEAIVAGTYAGRRTWIRLRLVDGCAIARWKRLAFLTPTMRFTGSG